MIGTILKTARNRAGISLAGLTKRLGAASTGTVTALEKAKSASTETIARICAALGYQATITIRDSAGEFIAEQVLVSTKVLRARKYTGVSPDQSAEGVEDATVAE